MQRCVSSSTSKLQWYQLIGLVLGFQPLMGGRVANVCVSSLRVAFMCFLRRLVICVCVYYVSLGVSVSRVTYIGVPYHGAMYMRLGMCGSSFRGRFLLDSFSRGSLRYRGAEPGIACMTHAYATHMLL